MVIVYMWFNMWNKEKYEFWFDDIVCLLYYIIVQKNIFLKLKLFWDSIYIYGWKLLTQYLYYIDW